MTFVTVGLDRDVGTMACVTTCDEFGTGQMLTERFQRLVDARGPFASIYFDDSYDMANPAPDLDVRWRDMSHALKQQGAAPDLMAVVKGAVLGAQPPVGRSGRCVIAASDGALIQEHVDWTPPAPIVRVSELPFIIPLIQHCTGTHTYLFVAVDHLGADITLHHAGGETTETVDPGGYPVHKATRADKGEYGEAQQRIDEMFRKNIKGVADRITSLVEKHGIEAVFVTGEVRARSALVSALPERMSRRVVVLHAGTRHTVSDQRAAAAIDQEFDRRRQDAVNAEAWRFSAERDRRSGIAVQGLGPVCAALDEGAVDTLLVGDLRNRTVIAGNDPTRLAPDADVLSQFGTAPTRILRADEALPFAAVAIGASVVCTGGAIDLDDGVGALLRYPEWAEASPPLTPDHRSEGGRGT